MAVAIENRKQLRRVGEPILKLALTPLWRVWERLVEGGSFRDSVADGADIIVDSLLSSRREVYAAYYANNDETAAIYGELQCRYLAAAKVNPAQALASLMPVLLQADAKVLCDVMALQLRAGTRERFVELVNKDTSYFFHLERNVLPYLHALENVERTAQGLPLDQNKGTVGRQLYALKGLGVDLEELSHIGDFRNHIGHGGTEIEGTEFFPQNPASRTGPVPADATLGQLARIFVPAAVGAKLLAFIALLDGIAESDSVRRLCARHLAESLRERRSLDEGVEALVDEAFEMLSESRPELAPVLEYLENYTSRRG